MKKKQIILKIMGIFTVLCVLGAAMLILQHTAQNGRKTTEIRPDIPGEPIYVECKKGERLETVICPKENFTTSGFQLLLVNFSSESRGSFQVTVQDSENNILANEVTPVNSINPGEWFVIPLSIDFEAQKEYRVSFLADGSEPFFMRITDMESANLPFRETVLENGEPIEDGISLGINIVTPVAVTFGEILYYSKPFCIAGALVLILFILFGKERIWETIRKVPFASFFAKYGNDLFLILLFAYLGLNIISKAYIKGVFISADSTGYLREAENIVKGNGFSYDGLAGYRSWFANWPIIYPAMIALIMLLTGLNAYLASKILSIAVIGVILIVLRLAFKKDAWIYALCLTNIGFMNLSCYTWSEVPFMLFMLIFALIFARILREKQPDTKWYVLLGLSGLCCFLTRYFGIYVWITVGLYLLYLFGLYRKNKDKMLFQKITAITATAAASGCLSIGYLALNKVMNGMPSGVSRSLWWDDYEILTNDLIESVLLEVTNAFSIQPPQIIEELPFNMKVWVILILLVGIIIFISKKARHLTTESVLITLGVCYYAIFIAIRYCSSMDTFYFRFFEPASFLICMGLLGLVIPMLRRKAGLHYFAAAITALLIIISAAMIQNGDLNMQDAYYDRLTAQWDADYQQIPQKSVIIFNDNDFRSSYYRPDIVDGLITPQDTMEALQETYYGSDYLCIRSEFVKTMLESGEYELSVAEALEKGLQTAGAGAEYVILNLK